MVCVFGDGRVVGEGVGDRREEYGEKRDADGDLERKGEDQEGEEEEEVGEDRVGTSQAKTRRVEARGGRLVDIIAYQSNVAIGPQTAASPGRRSNAQLSSTLKDAWCDGGCEFAKSRVDQHYGQDAN